MQPRSSHSGFSDVKRNALDQHSGPARDPLSRFLVWVDGVGGYLVLTGDSVVVGQAVLQSHVDIPILADVRRRHLKIARSEGGYLLESFGATYIGGKPVLSKAVLKHDDEIRVGKDVVLRFRKPHALSASVRLDVVSRHRTQPACDAILLMAESCVLGPGQNNHVVCHEWEQDLVLFKRNGELRCRSMQPFEVDGQAVDGQATLNPNCRIEGACFSLSLAQLSRLNRDTEYVGSTFFSR